MFIGLGMIFNDVSERRLRIKKYNNTHYIRISKTEKISSFSGASSYIKRKIKIIKFKVLFFLLDEQVLVL